VLGQAAGRGEIEAVVDRSIATQDDVGTTIELREACFDPPAADCRYGKPAGAGWQIYAGGLRPRAASDLYPAGVVTRLSADGGSRGAPISRALRLVAPKYSEGRFREGARRTADRWSCSYDDIFEQTLTRPQLPPRR